MYNIISINRVIWCKLNKGGRSHAMLCSVVTQYTAILQLRALRGGVG